MFKQKSPGVRVQTFIKANDAKQSTPVRVHARQHVHRVVPKVQKHWAGLRICFLLSVLMYFLGLLGATIVDHISHVCFCNPAQVWSVCRLIKSPEIPLGQTFAMKVWGPELFIEIPKIQKALCPRLDVLGLLALSFELLVCWPSEKNRKDRKHWEKNAPFRWG